MSSLTLSSAAHLLEFTAIRKVPIVLPCRQQTGGRRASVGVEALPTDSLVGYNKGVSLAQEVVTGREPGLTTYLDPEVSFTPPEAARFRKTKIVCTIGPTSCTKEDLFLLADQVHLSCHCHSSDMKCRFFFIKCLVP